MKTTYDNLFDEKSPYYNKTLIDTIRSITQVYGEDYAIRAARYVSGETGVAVETMMKSLSEDQRHSVLKVMGEYNPPPVDFEIDEKTNKPRIRHKHTLKGTPEVSDDPAKVDFNE